MSRKFWERMSANKVRFYGTPADYHKDELLADIAELRAVLDVPGSVKEIMVAAMPMVDTIEAFDKGYQSEIGRLADMVDYFGYESEEETISTFSFGWMSPADMALGPATVVDVCCEEIGNEAAGAIDGVGSNTWKHQENHAHHLVLDLGYNKRIDGIRFKKTASPPAATDLIGVDVRVAGGLAGLEHPEALVGSDLMADRPGDNDFMLTPRTGRKVKITVNSTGAGNNSITIRDIEFRFRAHTFGE